MVDRKWLSTLRLTDFRNYASLSLPAGNAHLVLTGDNGAGKTNLLEAISFLSPGRGMRRSAYQDISREGGSGSWAVAATLTNADGDVRIGTGLQSASETTRQIRIDGDIQKTSDSLLDYLNVMWLTPAMDGLFTGPGSDRRKFLDRMVLSIDSNHGRQVTGFEKSMRSRNRLLDDPSADQSWLDAIEIQMAEHACAIAAARRELVTLLEQAILDIDTEKCPFPAATLLLSGDFEDSLSHTSASDAEDDYRNMLKDNRWRDRAAGRTLQGPHRSDLKVRHALKAMPAEKCSTGEQKALLLGLVLAHARLVSNITRRSPILLLDEVAAHLDVHRRIGLFDMLDRLDCQAVMTGTDAAAFHPLGERARFFQVHDGALTEEAAR